ncbi:MAG: thiamine pyrophosphate-dependent enzyme [Caulobacteraceae bacterium]
MTEADSRTGLDRRELFGLAGAVGFGASAMATVASAQPDLSMAAVTHQPTSLPGGDMTTSDILVETLITWGAPFIFGMVGDGIGPLIEAIRKRQDRIRFIGVRHEEAAAFMASGFAKLTGRLGVCVGTTGPGAIHLMNGLYDAKMDGAPVVVITGTTYHDLQDMRFIQAVDTKTLMQGVALFNVEVTGPAHAVVVADRACRVALGERDVAHMACGKDVQGYKLSEDKPSMENHGLRTSSSWQPPATAPAMDQLRVAAEVLNSGQRVAILVGQGCLSARAEVERLADTLGAPVSKALLGRTVISDDSPFSLGGIGHLGTGPSEWAMHACDTVLILGSTMPWIDYYPKTDQARGVQVDLKPDRIGLRYPVEVGLIGDCKATLDALQPLLRRKADRSFLTEAQTRLRNWNSLLNQIETTRRSPLRPQMVVKAVSDLLPDNAVVTFECGANTHFAARHIRFKPGQRLISPGMLDTMAPGLPYANAAALAYPGRPVVAVVGDGGFAMLMAELTTAVQNQLPIKVVILKNNALAEVIFEQKEAGYGNFGTDLAPIDFVAFAKACGAQGFRCETPDQIKPAMLAAFNTAAPVIIEAIVDKNEPTLQPMKLEQQAKASPAAP